MESIKRARKAHGLSLADVAKLTGLHPVAIARAERTGKDVKASTLTAIAKALRMPVCELFEETGHERQRRKRQGKK